jgi:hypothetical protein
MTEENSFNIDPPWQGVIKWGGLSLFAAAAIGVIFVLLVLILQQTVPVPAKEALEGPATPTLLYLFAARGELFLLPGGPVDSGPPSCPSGKFQSVSILHLAP